MIKTISTFIVVLYCLIINVEVVLANINLSTDTSTEKELYIESFVNKEVPGSISHVSSIISLNGGKILCVWYSGSREGARDVAIYKAIFDEKEMKWHRTEKLLDRITAIAELKNYVKKLGNPMLMKDLSGKLWLFYSTAAFGGWSMTTLNYKTSFDGVTWSRSKKLLLSPFFNLSLNVKNDGINIDEKTFIIPAYGELFKKLSYLIKIETTNERAQIYKIANTVTAIQPVIIPEEEGLRLYFRNASREKERFILTTKGTVSDWQELTPTQLPNPNSGFDMIKVDEDIILGVINYSFLNRENLSLIVSADNGKSWKILKVLEDKEGKEYSYPSITESSNELYHITYTYERKRIKHVVFNRAWLYNRLNELGLIHKKSTKGIDHTKMPNKAIVRKDPLTPDLILKNLSEVSHGIAVTLTTVLLVSTLFLKFRKILGLKKNQILIILSLLIGTIISQLPINHLSLKEYILTLSPSISFSTLFFVLNFFLSTINYPLMDRKTLLHLATAVFTLSLLLYSSFFGFLRLDIYSFGYDYIYLLSIMLIITLYSFLKRRSLALLPLVYIIFFITGATLTSNFFDALTDGFAFLISFFIILNYMRLKGKTNM